MGRLDTLAAEDPIAESGAPAEEQVHPAHYLGRQPIIDHKLKLYGYELLFRDEDHHDAAGDMDRAISQAIDNYLLLIPHSNQDHAFVACTRETLVKGVVTLLPPRTTVLQLLASVPPDAEVIECCRVLKRRGYRFALDHFTPDESKRRLLQYADFVKVDFRCSDAAERKAIYAMAKPAGAKLLAEKVETEEEMKLAKAEGCSFFQGYFFSRPVAVSRGPIPSNHLVYLRLLAALSTTPRRTSEVEKIILSDATLCYRLLRIVNSALYSLASHVTSIRTAMLLVGDDGLRKLVSIALAGVYADRQPKALASMALERARFCELVASQLGEEPTELYLMGMLSLIDVVMQTPMAEILESLPLSEEIKTALCGGSNRLGSVLAFLRSYEAADWAGCEAARGVLGLSEPEAASLYLESLRWAAAVMREG